MAQNIGDALKNMSTKQKVMAGVIAIVLMVVLWQIKSMFGSAPVEEVTPVPASPKVAQGAPSSAMTAGAPSATPTTPGQMPPSAVPGAPAGSNMMPPASLRSPAQDAASIKTAEILAAQKEAQEQYLDALNKLQMLRVEREIAETNQAISKAKLETVTAEKGVSDLLANKSGSLPQLPASAYASQLAGGVPMVPSSPGTTPSPAATDIAPSEIPYVVVSVSMQFNKWTAVMGYKGEVYTVSIGDKLPADGSLVADINKNGVTLKKDGERRKISLLSTI